MIIEIKNKVNTQDWLKNTCECEGIGNETKILYSKLLSNFGDWKLNYFHLKEDENSETIGYAAGGLNRENNISILGFQIKKEFRNNKFGSRFFKGIINYYKDHNLNANKIVISTRNELMFNMIEREGFIYKGLKENSFLKNGIKDHIYEMNL